MERKKKISTVVKRLSLLLVSLMIPLDAGSKPVFFFKPNYACDCSAQGADKIDHVKRSLQSILGTKEVQAACLYRADGKKCFSGRE